MVGVSTKIKRLLLNEGLVSAQEWQTAIDKGGDVIEVLLNDGVLEENALMEVFGRSAGIPPIDLRRVTPDSQALEVVDKDLCKEHCILPLSKNGDILTVAVADPFNVILFDDLKRMTKCQVRAMFAHRRMLRVALDAAFDQGAAQVQEMMNEVKSAELLAAPEEEADGQDLESVMHQSEDAPAVKLANLIVLKALKERASDIHIEPCEKEIQVRLRVDGRLRKIMSPPKSLLPALSSRLKILASLDIAERNKPQDGKFRIRYEGRSIDFRLSILPVVGGEKSVIRILDAGSAAMSLDTLGWEPRSLADITKAIESPYGMMLVTGPTGSGKSTTLYSCVQEVATPEVNVTTVEDPVEFRMDGINQVPVNPKRGLTFAGALRSILRQDPDIVLIGEIRDKETADIAIKAALTGHLVFSTLHTNNAVATITRLVDMGIDPFMVSSSLLCIAAQRLGRRLCTNCKLPQTDVTNEYLAKIGMEAEDLAQGVELFKANVEGCARCNGGYRGRFAVVETLSITADIRRMIIQGKSAAEIKEQAISEGMLTLRRVGLLNAARGVTSLEEVLRITIDD
ncbi:MAG: Flp pilus assembly complex ATPase component TadA [Planctomycetes bacterium]|nr:Flp pilus assembly complex ATPase component TadA [Planctomycetota bacterium]MCB9910626.1 Flp pilus assembly complex ATPase component TadA [Planctomycetota bacterium]HPF13487.1 ATPase, T2SS/T4P/T4SS family [Planctomycetota bacterium]HRV80683.1 ATPase, T2SS/T4P/T4SS family [Planctomycetota bacterium]